MYIYFIFHFLIIYFFLLSINYKFDKKLSNFFYFYFILSLIFFTGLRFETGGDWSTYEYNFKNNGSDFKFLNFSVRSDYGWESIAYILYQLDLEYFILNLISSIFFFFSFSFYIKNFKYKILSYIISFPIIFIILLMGFTRQALAFSFLLISIKLITDKKFILSFIILTIGIFFHKSLLIFYFIFLLFPEKTLKFIKKQKIINVIFYSFLLILLLFLIFQVIKTDLSNLYLNYFGKAVNSNPISKGAYQRWFINLIPSLIFIFFHKRFLINIYEKRIYLTFSFLSIFLILAIPFFTTGVDRILYYFFVIQIFVFSYLPVMTLRYRKIYTFLISFYYLSILFIWLKYSYHSYLWYPYKNILLEGYL